MSRSRVPLQPERELDPALQFMRLLWAVDHGLQRASKRMHRALGVTGPQRLVIRAIGQFPGTSAGAVARLLHLHPSTLTGVLQRLVSDRLVSRAPDPVDRRRTVLHLTGRGHRLDRLHTGTVEAAVRAVLETTPAADRAAARRVLGRLADRLHGLR